jgi:MFS family permease
MVAEAQRVIETDDRRRWVLTVLCLGALLSGLNSTIVNVALPSIQQDLRIGDAALVWVINGYVTSAGGFLLLGGRLGDFFGGRPVLLSGVALFVVASLACGLAPSQLFLVLARLAQGVGGAVISAAALAEMTKLFIDPRERANAAGLYIFVSATGGSVGLVLGGILTSALSWHWVFLVNVPIGTAMYVLARRVLPREPSRPIEGSLDILGALTSTASLLLASYAIVDGSRERRADRIGRAARHIRSCRKARAHAAHALEPVPLA